MNIKADRAAAEIAKIADVAASAATLIPAIINLLNQLESFLQCETKSKLYFQGAAETDFEFKKWLRRERDCFKEGGLSWLRTMCQEDQFYVGTPSVEALKQKRWRIIADYVATSAEICAHLDALELTPATPNRMASFYRPLRFVPSEKLTGADRLLLAFDALAISHTMGKTQQTGKLSMAPNTEQR
jgi:hypothetical protein